MYRETFDKIDESGWYTKTSRIYGRTITDTSEYSYNKKRLYDAINVGYILDGFFDHLELVDTNNRIKFIAYPPVNSCMDRESYLAESIKYKEIKIELRKLCIPFRIRQSEINYFKERVYERLQEQIVGFLKKEEWTKLYINKRTEYLEECVSENINKTYKNHITWHKPLDILIDSYKEYDIRFSLYVGGY